VWPVATYGCESWTLRKNEETRLDAFEIKGLRRMLRVSWTAKKKTSKKKKKKKKKTSKLAYYGHTMRKETKELPGERDNARINARCTQARKATHGLDGQHQYVDMTPRGRVNQNDREQG